jgi:hypothetical protein
MRAAWFPWWIGDMVWAAWASGEGICAGGVNICAAHSGGIMRLAGIFRLRANSKAWRRRCAGNGTWHICSGR